MTAPVILLLGKDGQVGWELQRSLGVIGDVVALGRAGASVPGIDAPLCGDLTDLDGISRTVQALRPAVIVNAAAGSLPRQAAIAHVVYSPDVRRPVEIGADQEDQLVAWLSKRLGAKIRPPKLGALGYELIGGRLLPGSSGPVAQFMYHDTTGQRLTLYVTNEQASNQDTGFRFAQEGPVNVFYWIDGKFGYALSAGIDKGELARIATAVYAQLQPS